MSKQKINIIGNEVHVYRINISEQTNKISNLRKLLSNDETKKADRYRFAKDSNSYIISRGSINISYTEFGKPFIENSKINFNLSHSGDWCFIAVSLIKDIGIDIEKVRKIEDVLKIADRYFAINEYEHIKNFDSTEQINEFFRIWTLKEAFIKAIGEGLSFPLKNFSVISDKSDSPVLNLFENKDESELWKLDSLECQKGYNASLTVKADGIDLIYK